jgi:hypothetical protein
MCRNVSRAGVHFLTIQPSAIGNKVLRNESVIQKMYTLIEQCHLVRIVQCHILPCPRVVDSKFLCYYRVAVTVWQATLALPMAHRDRRQPPLIALVAPSFLPLVIWKWLCAYAVSFSLLCWHWRRALLFLCLWITFFVWGIMYKRTWIRFCFLFTSSFLNITIG